MPGHICESGFVHMSAGSVLRPAPCVQRPASASVSAACALCPVSCVLCPVSRGLRPVCTLRPLPRPGVSLFRHFRSHLAPPPTLQPHCGADHQIRQSVEQCGGVEHPRAHGGNSVRTRTSRAYGAEYFLVPCAREPFLRTGLTWCARGVAVGRSGWSRRGVNIISS